MARFVMANRRAGKFHESEKEASRAAADATFAALEANIDVVGDTKPSDTKARRVVVFDADPREVAAQTSTLPEDVLVEPEILHYPARILPLDLASVPGDRTLAPVAAGIGNSLTVRVRADGAPVNGAEVVLLLRGLGGRTTRLT